MNKFSHKSSQKKKPNRNKPKIFQRTKMQKNQKEKLNRASKIKNKLMIQNNCKNAQ